MKTVIKVFICAAISIVLSTGCVNTLETKRFRNAQEVGVEIPLSNFSWYGEVAEPNGWVALRCESAKKYSKRIIQSYSMSDVRQNILSLAVTRVIVVNERFQASGYYDGFKSTLGSKRFEEVYQETVEPLIDKNIVTIKSGLLQFNDGDEKYCVMGYLSKESLEEVYETARDILGEIPKVLDAEYREYFIQDTVKDYRYGMGV
jgi:hypothetical protein